MDQQQLPEKVACPFCDGNDTALYSPFGSQLSVSTYWCNHCHTAFERLKWQPLTAVQRTRKTPPA